MGRDNTPIELTPKQEAYLIKHFKHTKNAELAAKFGISLRSLNRQAKRLGLAKTKQFMRKCQAATTEAAKQSHLRNGTYPPKGYIIPGSEKYRFKAGVKPVDRLGEKREAERVAKAVASRKETYKIEKARAVWGIPRRTKLRVIQAPKKKILRRYYLKKCGYIIDEKAHVAYWTDTTKRAVKIEAQGCIWYKFAPLPVN